MLKLLISCQGFHKIFMQNKCMSDYYKSDVVKDHLKIDHDLRNLQLAEIMNILKKFTIYSTTKKSIDEKI